MPDSKWWQPEPSPDWKSWSSSSPPPPLSRIRLAAEQDIDPTYPLLASYALDPERALTVKELAVHDRAWQLRPSKWAECTCRGADAQEEKGPAKWTPSPPPGESEAKPEVVVEVDEKAHALLEERARGLGLSPGSTQLMLSALASKKTQLLAGKTFCRRHPHESFPEYGRTALVLLLSFCKNVTDLYVGELRTGFGGATRRGRGEPKPIEQDYGEYLLKCNYGLIPEAQRALQNLERVTVVGELGRDERDYYTMTHVHLLRLFHRLPKFASLVMDGTGEYQCDTFTFFPGTASPSFKRLQMRHVDVPVVLFGDMVRAARGLEEVVVSCGGLSSRDGAMSTLSPLKTLGKCLLTQKDTLRVLDLDVVSTWGQHQREAEVGKHDYGIYGDEEDESSDDDDDASIDLETESVQKPDKDDVPKHRMDEWFLLDQAIATKPFLSYNIADTQPYGYTIGSLSDFSALTDLSINIAALLGGARQSDKRDADGNYKTGLMEQPPFRLVDALPSSLESLCLYDYKKGECEDVDHHVEELIAKRADVLPKLKEIKGVEETVKGPGDDEGTWSEGDRRSYWERDLTCMNTGWIEMK